MNYYSDDIIKQIIDTSEIENIIENIEEFKYDAKMMFYYFSFYDIALDYIDNLLQDDKNIIAFRCIDNSEFNLRNCPSGMVYRKYKNNDKKEIHYYIFVICTKQNFKKLGYASALLDGFIERVKEETKNFPDYKTKIILSSVDKFVSYYEHYGFHIISKKLTDYPFLLRYEKLEKNKEYYIMGLDV